MWWHPGRVCCTFGQRRSNLPYHAQVKCQRYTPTAFEPQKRRETLVVALGVATPSHRGQIFTHPLPSPSLARRRTLFRLPPPYLPESAHSELTICTRLLSPWMSSLPVMACDGFRKMQRPKNLVIHSRLLKLATDEDNGDRTIDLLPPRSLPTGHRALPVPH